MKPPFIVRERKTNRFTPYGFSGMVRYNATVGSDSYLHVGSGEKEKDLEKYAELHDLVTKKGLIDVRDIPKEYLASKELSYFCHYGSRHDKRRKRVIPGSTVKGLSRFRLEHSFEIVNGRSLTCFVIQSKRPPARKRIANFLRLYGGGHDITPRPTCRGKDGYCTTCNIFGNMGLRSRVEFSDALLLNPEKIEYLRTEFGNYLEVVKEGGKFQGRINFNNLSLEEIGLVFYSLEVFSGEPVPVGLSKYRRLNLSGSNVLMGKVRFELANVLVKKTDKTYKKDEGKQSLVSDSEHAVKTKYGGYLRKIGEYE